MKRATFLVIGIAGLLMTGASLEDRPVSEEQRKATQQLRGLEKRIQIAAAINKLSPTRDQLLKLLEVAKKAETIRKSFGEKKDKLLEQQLQAFDSFKKEDVANKGFSKEVEQKAGKLDNDGKELQEKYNTAIGELEKETETILTPAQKALIKYMNEGLAAPKKREKRDKETMPGPIGEFVRKIRALNDNAYPSAKEKIAGEFIDALKQRPRLDAKGEIDKGKLIDVMNDIRLIPEEYLDECMPRIAKAILPKNEAIALHEDLREARQSKYNEFGNLGKFISSPFVVSVIKKRLDSSKGGAQ